MCSPVALTVMTVASGVLDYAGKRQAASAQEKANNRSRELAIQNQNLQIRSLQNQADEDRRQATQAILDNQKDADAARSTAAVAAGESGVSGLSIDALMGDLVRQETDNRLNILSINSFQQRQRELDREGIGITAQSQINQLPLVEYPSFASAALSTAMDGVGTYQRAKAREPK